ncbi:SAVMC3_10250 family protein [Streptomyces sp. NBC_00059]|uniref:SAVMC3_10250 family protein n=1 Tax=Streptomyces sp. NBC_00059 TaxID=2975635 RepID=UPI0022586F48|nr:SAVMC3_10250 family protein [Streptomyces sp. NBC_00059]MCX5415732.1 SAVMC3_10250 family protein [Streptomyces sp. NBC_00059]
MRELVYLSDSKLRQFLPERGQRRRIGRRLRMFRLDGNTPVGGGGFEVHLDGDGPTTAEDRAHRLASTIDHLESHALWFTDPDTRPGRWIYFEAPLSFFHVDSRDPDVGTVLFVDVPGIDGYDQDGTCLILHGSAKHLLVPVPRSALAVSGVIGSMNSLDTRPSITHRLWDVERPPPPPTVGELADPPPERAPELSPINAQNIGVALHDIRRRRDDPADTAAWMRGYARVTRVERYEWAIVYATPLNVEYAVDLPSD